jgi:hypothetical protein
MKPSSAKPPARKMGAPKKRRADDGDGHTHNKTKHQKTERPSIPPPDMSNMTRCEAHAGHRTPQSPRGATHTEQFRNDWPDAANPDMLNRACTPPAAQAGEEGRGARAQGAAQQELQPYTGPQLSRDC